MGKYTTEQIQEICQKALSGKAIGRENALALSEILSDDKMRDIYNKQAQKIEAERAEKQNKHLLVQYNSSYGATVSFENFPFRKKLRLGENKLVLLEKAFQTGLFATIHETMDKAKETGKEYTIDASGIAE